MALRLGSNSITSALVGCLVLGSVPAHAQGPASGAPAPPAPTVAPPAPTVAPATPSEAPTTSPAQPVPVAPPPEGVAPPAPAAVAPPQPAMAAPLPQQPDFPPPMAPPEEAAPAQKPKLPAYLFWGVGGASCVVGTIFGIAALSNESDFKKNPTYSKADSVHNDTVASDVGLGLGVVLLVSGTLFYFIEDKDPSGAQQARHDKKASPLASLSVEPVVGRQTHGGTVTLRF